MASLTKSGRKTVKGERYLKVVGREGAILTVEIHAEKRKPETYLIFPADSAFGRAFEVRKTGAEQSYHVCLDGDRDYCDCPGACHDFRCRHLGAVEALIRAGKL